MGNIDCLWGKRLRGSGQGWDVDFSLCLCLYLLNFESCFSLKHFFNLHFNLIQYVKNICFVCTVLILLIWVSFKILIGFIFLGNCLFIHFASFFVCSFVFVFFLKRFLCKSRKYHKYCRNFVPVYLLSLFMPLFATQQFYICTIVISSSFFPFFFIFRGSRNDFSSVISEKIDYRFKVCNY